MSVPFVLWFVSVNSCQFVVAACWQEQVYFLIYFTRLWPKEKSLRFSLILLKRPVLFRVELRKKTSRKVKCTWWKNSPQLRVSHVGGAPAALPDQRSWGIKPLCQCCRHTSSQHVKKWDFLIMRQSTQLRYQRIKIKGFQSSFLEKKRASVKKWIRIPKLSFFFSLVVWESW